MGDEQDGQPQLPVEPPQQGQDRLGRGGVERGGGLVRQQHRRLGRERPRDADPLLLPAGQLRGVGPRAVGQAHEVEHLRDPPGPGGPADAHDLQREGHVARHRARRQQREVLVDHADPLAGAAQIGRAEGGQLASVDGHAALVGAFEQVDAAQQGALAGAAAPEHAEDLPPADVQVDAVERDDVAVGLAQAGDRDHLLPPKNAYGCRVPVGESGRPFRRGAGSDGEKSVIGCVPSWEGREDHGLSPRDTPVEAGSSSSIGSRPAQTTRATSGIPDL